MAAFMLVLDGRDDWSERRLDQIEAAAGGAIAWQGDNGAGGTRFWISPSDPLDAPRRGEILEAVRAIAPNARWIDLTDLSSENESDRPPMAYFRVMAQTREDWSRLGAIIQDLGYEDESFDDGSVLIIPLSEECFGPLLDRLQASRLSFQIA